MRINIDEENKIIYIYEKKKKAKITKEINEYIRIDLDEKNNIVGVEIEYCEEKTIYNPITKKNYKLTKKKNNEKVESLWKKNN